MSSDQPVCLSVCTRCRPADIPGTETERPGYLLAGALRDLARADEALPGLTLRGIHCMSQCKRPCVVALSAPAKFTLVFGDLDAGTDASAILHLASLYARSDEGLVARPDRPDCLRSGILGRIPPLGYAGDLLIPVFSHPPQPV